MTDREALLSGQCPLCPRGPFRMPLHHVSLAHKIGQREARRLFGCQLTERLCSAETHDLKSRRRRGLKPPPRRLGTYRCASCGTTFEARRYRDDQAIPRYCSIRCKGKAS